MEIGGLQYMPVKNEHAELGLLYNYVTKRGPSIRAELASLWNLGMPKTSWIPI